MHGKALTEQQHNELDSEIHLIMLRLDDTGGMDQSVKQESPTSLDDTGGMDQSVKQEYPTPLDDDAGEGPSRSTGPTADKLVTLDIKSPKVEEVAETPDSMPAHPTPLGDDAG